MPRKAKQLTTSQNETLRQMALRGCTAAEIHTALKGALSPATIARRVAEIRGPSHHKAPRTRTAPRRERRPEPSAPGAPRAAPAPPRAPDDDGDGDVTSTDIPALLGRLLGTLQGLDTGANVAATTAVTRAATQCAALLAKVTPPPPTDPEAHPDMVAAAEQCRTKLRMALERRLAAEGLTP